MRYFTIPEAAKFVGVNVKTMRKHVREGRIESVETPLGVKVTEEVLLAYAPPRTNIDQAVPDQDAPEETNADQSAPTRLDQIAPDQAVPLAAHLAALEFAERRLAEERERFEQAQRQCADARLRAEQAERSRMAMEFQLQKYQSVLAENAESLAEERAFRLQAETKLLAVELPPAPPIENLKVASPVRKGWGQRVRGWLGLKEAQG
ncbi:MAG: helix-turn-helix domain-containing protein [Fimbriimonadaceae bacterium]|nr:helix-turn-helix domain-containing protein [Fimbriimonadaceae bacterium]